MTVNGVHNLLGGCIEIISTAGTSCLIFYLISVHVYKTTSNNLAFIS